MSYRNDPSSLSFGARLRRAEADAAQAKSELAELKQALPNSKDLQAAAMTGDVIKQQRRGAKQMMARADVTLDELNTIDPSVLTPQAKEQLKLSKTDAAWRALPMQSQGFQFSSPLAESRYSNWKSTAPQREFARNDQPPTPQRPVDLWRSRQDTPQGRFEQRRKQEQSIQKDLMLRQSEAQRAKPKSKGVTLGKVRPIDQ